MKPNQSALLGLPPRPLPVKSNTIKSKAKPLAYKYLVNEKYTQEYKLDRKTRAKTEEILKEFFRKNPEEFVKEDEISTDLHVTVRAAILIASKCQTFVTDDGRVIRGCGLSITLFLHGKPQILIEDFHQKLVEMLSVASIEYAALTECTNVQNKISINLNFYTKFTKVWDQLLIKDRTLNVACAEQTKKMCWMTFIIGKIKILENRDDITETAFLLLSTILIVLYYLPAQLECKILDDFLLNSNPKDSDKLDRVEPWLVEALKHKFNIKEVGQEVEYFKKQVLEMLYKMKSKQRIVGFRKEDEEPGFEDTHFNIAYPGICDSLDKDKSLCNQLPSRCLHGILDPQNLNRNLHSLDQYYQKQVDFDADFDDRYFINSEGRLRTPIKLISPITYSTNQVKPPQGQSPMTQKTLVLSGQLKRHKGDNLGPTLKQNQITNLPPKAEPNFPSSMMRKLDFNSSLNEISLRQTLKQTPFPNLVNQSPLCHPATQSTPISSMMEIKRWVEDVQKNVVLDQRSGFNNSLQGLYDSQEQAVAVGQQIKATLQDWIQKVLTQLVSNTVRPECIQGASEAIMKTHSGPIYQICCRLIEMILMKESEKDTNSKLLKNILCNTTFQKSMLLYSCQVQFFLKSQNDISFVELLQVVQLNAYDFWRTMEAFLTADKIMPKKLKEYFYDQEKQIVQHFAWQKMSPVVDMVRKLLKNDDETLGEGQQQNLSDVIKKQEEEKVLLRPYHIFFKRVLNIAAMSLQELCDNLSLDEGVKEVIWCVVKVLLSQETDLLIGRHLDQLIMCCVYSVCRVQSSNVRKSSAAQQENHGFQGKQPVTFNEIIESYKNINQSKNGSKLGRIQLGAGMMNAHRSNNVSWVFIEVPLDPESDESQKVDIIEFYNKVFLQRMKVYILATKTMEMEQGSRTPVLNRSNMDNLLTPGGRSAKAGIKTLCPMTPLVASAQNTRRLQPIYSNVHMTPNTKQLYANEGRQIQTPQIHGAMPMTTAAQQHMARTNTGKSNSVVFGIMSMVSKKKQSPFQPKPEPKLIDQASQGDIASANSKTPQSIKQADLGEERDSTIGRQLQFGDQPQKPKLGKNFTIGTSKE